MQERALHFVEIPERSRKPRRVGLTLARDLGLGYDLAASWIEAVGEFIDFVKVRHLFVLLMRDEESDVTRRKIDLYRRHNIDVNPGGIVFEMAVLSNAVERTFATLAHLGFTAVELSENIIPLSLDDKVRYVRQARDYGLKVLFEVGEKYPSETFDVERTATEIEALLEAGCHLVILEKSQLDLCLGSRAENPQAGKLAELAARVGLERIVFEAEATTHQAWLFRRFGPDVNVGPNVDIDLVCKLEATRRTLSREGGYGFLADRVARSD